MGLEIGLFLDEDCLMYTPKLSFADIMEDADTTYYGMISDVVEFTFTNDGIECYDPDIVWYNQVDYYYEQMEAAENNDDDAAEDDDEEEDEDEEEPEAAEWCQDIVQEDIAVDINDCGGYEADDEDDDENNGDDDYAAVYDWYRFELTADQSEDIGAVCTVYQTSFGAAANDDAAAAADDGEEYDGYTPHTVYNGDNGGLFNYERGNDGNNEFDFFGLSTNAIIIVSTVVFAVAVVGVAAVMFLKKKSGEGGSTDKKKPLMNDGDGAMA